MSITFLHYFHVIYIFYFHEKDGKGYISAADIRPAVISKYEMVGND